MIEYTKHQWIEQKYHNVLQWDRHTQNIIRYDNKLILIYLIREKNLINLFFININFVLQCLPC